MDINITVENGTIPVTVMAVNGNIDASTYEQFQAAADKLIKGGARHILVDLAKSPFVSSAGLRALHQIFNELRAVDPSSGLSEEEVRHGINDGTYKSPHLKLVNLSKETRTTFELSGFDMFIESFDSLDAALASFQPVG